MNFSRIAKQLNEGESLNAAASASEKATQASQTNAQANVTAKARQKAQMAQQSSTTKKSDVSYASEEAKVQRTYDKMWENNKSDWRAELNEAAGPNDQPEHPYVDVMPSVNQKENEAKRQMKAAAKSAVGSDGHHQAGEGGGPGDIQKESASNPFQVHFDQDGKPYKSKGSKKDRERIAKNISDNRKRGPMAYDPFKSRAGESD